MDSPHSPMFNSPDFNEEFSSKLPALAVLIKMGYQYLSPSQCTALRSPARRVHKPQDKAANAQASSQVILLPVLRDFLRGQSLTFEGKAHTLSEAAIDTVVAQLRPALNVTLVTANETLYNQLLLGVTVTEFIDGKKANLTVPLLDWASGAANVYHVTEEMTVRNTDGTADVIPDVVCFINGLPLAVIEAKRPAGHMGHRGGNGSEPTTMQAVSQHIRNQKPSYIPHLFAYSQLLLAVNGVAGLYGTCETPKKFWAKWIEEEIDEDVFYQLKNQRLTKSQLDRLFEYRKDADKAGYVALIEAGKQIVTDQDRLIVSLLRPDRLLKMMQLYTLFDSKIGRIVARYQQVFGIEALLARVRQVDESGRREGGVIWHTTGSGKSFTMAFLAKALIYLEDLKQCRVIVVTDRVDLETQLSNTFKSGGILSDKRDRRDAMATSGRRLAEQIGHGKERVIFTIINKFGAAAQYPECYNPSKNIIVLVDEGHRSQNGENNIRMRQALPNAAFVAFTGTPLLKDDKTQNKFGKIIHSYTMQQAVRDKTVTPLLYEPRIPELATNDTAIDTWFERITEPLSEAQKADLKRKFAKKGQIYQVQGRIELIAHDISDHFENFKQLGLKGQLACDSKASAIRYKLALDKIGKVTSAVAISSPDTREGHDAVDKESSDIVQNWWMQNVAPKYGMDDREYTKAIVKAFEQDNGPDIMIVVDKLLTGFDEPKNTVLYIDKPLKSHNLIQAIARVNRLHEKKQFGYLIDYRGVLAELDTTIEHYQDLAERTQGGFDIDDLKGLYHSMDTEYKKLPKLHRALWAIFDDVENKLQPIALQQALVPKIIEVDGHFIDRNLQKRDTFYAALTKFASTMTVALQSASYFEDKAFDDKREPYKNDLKAFMQLRALVRENASETVDYGTYEEDIRHLLDKHIAGLEVTESLAVYEVDKLGKHQTEAMSAHKGRASVDDLESIQPLNRLSDDEARNQSDKLMGRVTQMIEQDLADDPYAQAYFSKLLKQAIEDAKAMFDAPLEQFEKMRCFEQAIKSRDVADVQTRFIDEAGERNQQAQAYFGLFKQQFSDTFLAEKGLDEEALVDMAFEIDQSVKTAVAEYSLSPAEIESQIRRALLPSLFNCIGLEAAQQLITDVLKIVRLGLAKNK